MCLWQPSFQNTGTLQTEDSLVPDFSQVLSRPVTTFKIVHVWMHECMRTFGDRLCSDHEKRTLLSLITETAVVHFGITAFDVFPSVCREKSHATNTPDNQQVNGEILSQCLKPADHYTPIRNCFGSDPSLLAEHDPSVEARLPTESLQSHILQHMQSWLDKFVYGPNLSVAVNKHFKCSYQEQDRDVLLKQLCELIKEDNSTENYNIATKCIVHRQRMDYLLHILRALLIPGGHGLLISSHRGTGT